MLFLKNKAWWILSIVIGLGIIMFLWSGRGMSVKEFQHKISRLSGSDKEQFVKSVIENQLHSEAGLYLAINYYDYGIDGNGDYIDIGKSHIDILRTACEYHPKSTDLLLELASILHVLQDDGLDEAAALAREVIRLDPSNLRGHEMYGTMLQELGYYKRALAHLKQAQKLIHTKMESELQHSHPHAHNSIGFVREIDGEEITLSFDEWRDYDISQNIKAIETGTPLIGPRAKKQQ